MKINQKLYVKYGTNSMILPPAPELEEEVSIPLDGEDLSSDPKWRALDQAASGMDPLTEMPALSDEEMLASFKSSIPPYEAELMQALNLDGNKKAPSHVSTVPPGKRNASLIDGLVKRCGKYYDLCRKL